MITNLHLNFLREKINDIRTALFFSMSKSVLKLPNCIVSAIHVDDMGQIWLVMPKPTQEVKEFEQKFPVKLNFYKKGKDFFLNVTGTACLVFEPAEIDEMIEIACLENNKLTDNWILVKVEIVNTYYHGATATNAKHSPFVYLSSLINKWLFPENTVYEPLALH